MKVENGDFFSNIIILQQKTNKRKKYFFRNFTEMTYKKVKK